MGGIAWTEEEDNLLKKCIRQYGEGKWHRVPLLAGLNRCRKSCRLRWLNYLRPNIKRGHFSHEEADIIIQLHKLLGNRWSLIAGRLPGRTANDVKNYWNCHLSKKLNVQETELNSNNNDIAGSIANVTRVNPRNIDTSCPRRPCFKPPEDEGSPSKPVSCIEQNQVYLKEDNGISTWDEEYGAIGEFSTNVRFEHVRVREEEETNYKWDWDDFILDLDLWNDSF